MIPRGLVLQEGDADKAQPFGLTMAAKRWPASGGFGVIENALDRAEELGLLLMVGWMWQNETYTGAPSALPAGWNYLEWDNGRGPNYADLLVRSQILESIRELARRFDDHPRIAAIMCNVGDDGERRFCKQPIAGSCRDAHDAAGLNHSIWAGFVRDVIQTYAESFTKTPVLFHFSGMGYHPAETGRDVQIAVDAGLGLMTSGLYPGMCRGNSMGGECNPLEPLMVDWQVPGVWPDAPFAAEQSLAYKGNEAALCWLWAVTHGAMQIHAQAQTMANSIDTEWRETAEYMLENPDAAIWVARELDSERCKTWYGEHGDYCGEKGNWYRNITEERCFGELGFNVAESYRGWVARSAPIHLTTTVTGPAEIHEWAANGEHHTWTQESGENVSLAGDGRWVHRVEVRPLDEIPTPPEPPEAEYPRYRLTGTVGPFEVDILAEVEK